MGDLVVYVIDLVLDNGIVIENLSVRNDNIDNTHFCKLAEKHSRFKPVSGKVIFKWHRAEMTKRVYVSIPPFFFKKEESEKAPVPKKAERRPVKRRQKNTSPINILGI